MDNLKMARTTMVSTVSTLVNKISLDELNLIVTDTVLNWAIEDVVLKMIDDYKSCVRLSSKLQSPNLTSSERDYAENVKTLCVNNLFDMYQTYSVFAELSDMRGKEVDAPQDFEPSIVDLLRQEGCLLVSHSKGNSSHGECIRMKKNSN